MHRRRAGLVFDQSNAGGQVAGRGDGGCGRGGRRHDERAGTPRLWPRAVILGVSYLWLRLLDDANGTTPTAHTQ